jgi:TetR/AcrR family transcriptional regulator, transcriptional repressor for nem operon
MSPKYELTHERIVATAARSLRRGGFEALGVAEVMKETGLTHGGFYAHFKSRDALLSEAFARAAADSRETTSAAGPSFRDLIELYLSEAHVAGGESACPVAACLSEIPHQTKAVRRVANEEVARLVELVRERLPRASTADAMVIAASMLGTLQLARSLDEPAQVKRLLTSARKSLLAQYEG